WILMPCYAGRIHNIEKTSESILMTFLKSGGAIYIGGTEMQMGGVITTSGVSVGTDKCNLGGDKLTGNLYTRLSKGFSIGKRIGDVFKEKKIEYYNIYKSDACAFKIAHQTLLYGDPTIKIKSMW
ncbi:MAG: C25 family cysteine peptidase, partial [Candidatus Aenigmatarchaeota archaeon]